MKRDFLNTVDKKTSNMIAILLLAILVLLAVGSLFVTVVFPESVEEQPYISLKYSISGIVSVVVIAIIALLIQKRVALLNTQKLFVAMIFVVSFISLFWLSVTNAHPADDQAAAISLGESLSNGDTSIFEPGTYLARYQHQISYVLFHCMFGQLFGFDNWVAYRLFNIVMMIGCCLLLVKIVQSFTKNQACINNCLLLCMAFVPFALFTNFIYGTVPSLTFCLFSCFLQLRAVESKSTKNALLLGIGSTISLLVALLFKPNSLIFLIGIELVWLLLILASRNKLYALFLAANIIVYVVANGAPLAYVEKTYGVELGEGTPKTAWIAMGIQESKDRPPGWWNGYVREVVDENNGDYDRIDSDARADIAERLGEFSHDPIMAVSFFSRKVATEWFEPTFESLWLGFRPEKKYPDTISNGMVQSSFKEGILRDLYIFYCDGFQTLVYASAAFAIFKMRKRLRIQHLLLGIIVIGGFLFHFIWEAKSDYLIPYFILLLPYAAVGLTLAGRAFRTSRFFSGSDCSSESVSKRRLQREA